MKIITTIAKMKTMIKGNPVIIILIPFHDLLPVFYTRKSVYSYALL